MALPNNSGIFIHEGYNCTPAVSEIDVYTAFIIDETGIMLTSDSYGHTIAPNEN